MRLLIITQYFWPENFPINNLAAGLQDLGHKVTVLTGIPNYPEGYFFSGYGVFRKNKEEYRGIKIYRVPLVPRGGGGGVRLAVNYFSFAAMACMLGPFLCRKKYDAIFVWGSSPITVGFPALLIRKIKGIPLFFWVQDLWPESLSATGAIRSKRILSVVERMVRFIYKRCDRILVQSRAFIPSVVSHGGQADRIAYFPNCADEMYRPIYARSESIDRGSLPEGFCVLYAGNIGAAQDFGTVLKAAEMMKAHEDIHWVIFGEGRMRTWVEDQISKRGLAGTVHLKGRVQPEEMPRYFAAADVLMASLRKDPIFALTIPAKVQSYLACGKPIVVAIDGEAAMIVDEAGAGISSPAGDPGALSKAILHVYRMSFPERQEMGARGRKYFETHFDRGMLLGRLNGWMKEICSDKGKVTFPVDGVGSKFKEGNAE